MKLFVTDSEINHLLPDLLPADLPVERIRLCFKPEGLVVHGEYPALGFRVAFEMLWVVAALPGEVAAHLKDVIVAGFGAGKFRGLLLKLIRDAIAGTPGVKVEDDRAVLNLAELLRQQKISARVEVTAIRCLNGALEIETTIDGK